jgi:hypothetical protein
MGDKKFKFDLASQVTITASGETGTVQGRAEYVNAENNYYVLYKTPDGRATQEWWPESTLSQGA